LLGACAHAPKPYSAREAVAALSAKAAELRTARGRAWISARVPEQSISFPANIAIDATNPSDPKLRLEAMDPLGATHALMVVSGGRLTWVDFDNQRVYEMRERWHGIPVRQLPGLLFGASAPPDEGTVGAAGENGFELRTDGGTYRYEMRWIDPGPRLALEGIDARLLSGKKEHPYGVRYSKFLDKPDLYLPQEVELTAKEVEIKLAWRERYWNEGVPAQAFVIPRAATEGFERIIDPKN
jgi:hypothetical protein